MRGKRLSSFIIALSVLVPVAQATVSSPDHIIYGNATLFGQPVSDGTVIEARFVDTGDLLTRYSIGRDPDLGGQFALRIPMDSVDPRVEGTGRPGDPIRLFIGPDLAGETTVGGRGRAVRLDLDPQNLGTGPSVFIDDAQRVEGDAGTSQLNFAISMNTTSDDTVEIDWSTADDTAVGGSACTAGVDYIAAAQTLSISPGDLNGTVTVLVCGESAIEADEQFNVVFDQVRFGVIGDGLAIGSILDDDDIPDIHVDDVFVFEPASGTQDARFRVSLSRSSPDTVSVSYNTVGNDAVAGQDFTAASGVLSIAPGIVEEFIDVDILADGSAEPNESFMLELSNPVAGNLLDTSVLGLIVDPRYDPAVAHEDDVTGPDSVADLLDPTAVVVAPGGEHVYVTSESLDALLLFERSPFDSTLQFVTTYDNSTAGFSGAPFGGLSNLAISPDGNHLYAAAPDDNALAVLARNPTTGTLSLVESQVDGAAPVQGLAGVGDVAVSPDGAHVYAVGSTSDSVAAFARDPGTGALTFIEAELDGSNGVTGLTRPAAVIVDRDGDKVYVAARLGDAVLVFDRNAGGELVFAEVHQDGLLGVEGLDGAVDLVQSFDRQHVYVVAETDNTVVRFRRQPDGALVWEQQLTQSDPDVEGLGGARSIALTADDSTAVVAGFADDSISVFRRASDPAEPDYGDFSVLQTVFDEQGGIFNMAGPADVRFTPDGEHFYVVANLDNAIVLFRVIDPGVLLTDGFEDP